MVEQPSSSGKAGRRVAGAARLAVAPSGLLLAGVGAGIGLLTGLPWWGTVALAAAGWLAGLGVGLWRRWWRNLPLVTIDPFAVTEPWRSLVRDALATRQRFDELLAHWPAGPLHDRLTGTAGAVHGATDEVWRISKLGSSLAAPDTYATEDLSRRMRAIQRQPSPAAPGAGGFDEEATLASQLQAIRRRQTTTTELEVHVRTVVTQLDVAVTELAGLAAGTDTSGSGFARIDELASELHSLGQAVGELGPYQPS